jgi:hydroxyacylglutathione hydrolase
MESWKARNGHSIYQVLSGRSNAYIVSNSRGCFLLVDTGVGKSRKKLESSMAHLGVKGEALCAIILTHAHFDHVENSQVIKTQYGSLVFAHKEEAPYYASGNNAPIVGTFLLTQLIMKVLGTQFVKRLRYTPVTIDHLVYDRLDLSSCGFEASIIHTPGHTIGSLSLIIGDDIAVVGDALYGVVRGSVIPPFGTDLPLMVKSWGKLLDTGASLFLPGHGSSISRSLLEEKYKKYCLRLGLN